MDQTKSSAGRRLRRWLPYGVAAAVMALIVGGLWPKAVPVESAPVVVGPMQVSVNEEGKTRIRQRYVVSAPVAGQLQRVAFKAGAPVVAAQTVLAVVEPVSPTLLDARSRLLAQAGRDSAAASLAKAQAAEQFAGKELRRFDRLYAEKAVSVQEYEAAQLREASATKEVNAAEGALHRAEAELAEFCVSSNAPGAVATDPQIVTSPVDGRVLRVFEESSRVVGAGTPLVEVGNPQDLEVVVEVLSRDGAGIQPGARVEFDQWGGAVPLQGRVRLVEPAAFTKVSALGVEEQRVNVVADLTTPVEQRLGVGDNFRVEARIITWEQPQVLKVPAGALFRRGEQWATYVRQAGRAELRPVQVGPSNGVETQILSGLKAGEVVILYPGNRIQAGQRVTPIKF